MFWKVKLLFPKTLAGADRAHIIGIVLVIVVHVAIVEFDAPRVPGEAYYSLTFCLLAFGTRYLTATNPCFLIPLGWNECPVTCN